MSKKHKKIVQENITVSGGSMHAAEYQIIRHDLWKVLYLNLIYLAALLVVYFTDQRTQYLEHWFGKLFHF